MRTVIIQQSTLVRQSPFGCLLIASNAPSLFVGVVQSLMLGILQEDSGTTYGNLNDCIIIKLTIKYSNIDSYNRFIKLARAHSVRVKIFLCESNCAHGVCQKPHGRP
jgi:hypothetical protein